MKIVCDNCTTKYSIADEKVRGKVFKIKCKKCSHIIVVKGEATTGEGQPAGFDQKETRVFDYSGFEGQRAAGGGEPAGGGADPIWHLVIDREQVGPLTVAELAAKWDGGEIDRDTYAWREGFADWQRLAAVEELASVVHRDAAPARASAGTERGGLFADTSGTPASGSPMPTRADPTDLFAGAGTSTEDEIPPDLFGGADRSGGSPGVFASSAAPAAASSSSRRSQKEDLFGGSSDVDAGAGDTGSGQHDVRPTMTGQRNENSVLFSLNNLSALANAGVGDRESRSSSGGGGGGGLSSFGSAGGSGAEGSGLIDIRAMAEMTMGSGGKRDQGPRVSRPSADDLPVFSASSFSAPAAGVLMPTVQPQNNRMMIMLMAAFAFLAAAAIVLVAVILFGGKGTPTTEPTVGGEPIGTAPSAPATTPPPAASPTPTAPSSPGRPTPPPTSPSTTPAVTPPAPTTPERPTTAPRAPARPVAASPTRAPEPRAPEPRPEPSRPAPSSEPPVPKPQKCDEVACLVTPDLPCCPKRAGTAPKPTSGDSGLQEKLEQSDIISGMKAVSGRVMACNDRYRTPGSFKVKITVAPDGHVTNAGASAPVAGTPAAGCVENAVRSARFKKTKSSITFNYPFTFR